MLNLYSAQIELPIGAHAPDPWDHGSGVQLKLDHVISKDADGNPLTLVGDLRWNWTFNTPRKTPSFLPFDFWDCKPGRRPGVSIKPEVTTLQLALVREMQYLMVMRVYHAERPLGYQSLLNDVLSIGKFAVFAQGKCCSLKDVLEQQKLLDAFISNVPESQCKDVVRWLNFLRTQVTINQLGFELAVPKKWAELVRRSNEYIKSRNQTAPLPTRIYAAVINALESELDDFEAHKDRLLAALREALVLHKEHYAKKAHRDPGLERGVGFGPDLISKYGLAEFLICKGLRPDLTGLSSAVTNIQRVCKIQVHAFSGMRDEEAEYLPYHCMEIVKAGNSRKQCLFVGVTTKLAGARRKDTRWVTTEEQGFRAARLAQAFADVVYEHLGVTHIKEQEDKYDFPLFVSTGYLPWSSGEPLFNNSVYVPTSILRPALLSDPLKAALCPIIEADDILELIAIDQFRDWATDPEFAVGQPWSLKSHQLRRSLALYANASGLVKSSSLKRQLQHLTREMAEYYGRGSVFAKNFLKDDPEAFKKHICFEWQDTEHEAQSLAFVRDVLNTDETLYGPAGVFYELKQKRGEVMTSKDVKHQLKLGRMGYRQTPLGGCTNLGACDKQKGLRFTRVITNSICISENCKSLIGKHSKIIQLIPLQRRIVASLEPGSIVFDMEKEELDILEGAEVKWRAASRPQSAAKGVGSV